MIAFEAGPSLERVMMPGAASEVFVYVKIAVAENVEAGAFLIADDDGERVLEFFAEADIEHAGVERTAPHGNVKPTRAWKRAGDGAGKKEIFGCGEHGVLGVNLRITRRRLKPSLQARAG